MLVDRKDDHVNILISSESRMVKVGYGRSVDPRRNDVLSMRGRIHRIRTEIGVINTLTVTTFNAELRLAI